MPENRQSRNGNASILITGASGFVGRRLALRLSAERLAAEVKYAVGFYDDPFCRSGAAMLRSKGIDLIRVDLISTAQLNLVRKPRIVFHLAANTHTWESDQDCNDVGTRNLIEAIQPLGPENHIVFTSTVAVLDNRTDLDQPLTSDSQVRARPFSRYGISKWRAEEFLVAKAREQGFRLTILRLSTVYGPDPRPNTFFDVLGRAVQSRGIVTRLNWPGLTSFIHVEDVVDCLLSAMETPPAPGEVRYGLLATQSFRLPEIASMLYRSMSIAFRPLMLSSTVWDLMAASHAVCRWTGTWLPAQLFNQLWRFDLLVNPVFHCDTSSTARMFPNLKPRLVEDYISANFR